MGAVETEVLGLFGVRHLFGAGEAHFSFHIALFLSLGNLCQAAGKVHHDEVAAELCAPLTQWAVRVRGIDFLSTHWAGEVVLVLVHAAVFYVAVQAFSAERVKAWQHAGIFIRLQTDWTLDHRLNQ